MFPLFRTARQKTYASFAAVSAAIVFALGIVGYRAAQDDNLSGGDPNPGDGYANSQSRSNVTPVGRGCTTLTADGQEKLLPSLTDDGILREMERKGFNPDLVPVDEYENMALPGNVSWSQHNDVQNGEGISVHGIGRVDRSMLTPQGYVFEVMIDDPHSLVVNEWGLRQGDVVMLCQSVEFERNGLGYEVDVPKHFADRPRLGDAIEFALDRNGYPIPGGVHIWTPNGHLTQVWVDNIAAVPYWYALPGQWYGLKWGKGTRFDATDLTVHKLWTARRPQIDGMYQRRHSPTPTAPRNPSGTPRVGGGRTSTPEPGGRLPTAGSGGVRTTPPAPIASPPPTGGRPERPRLVRTDSVGPPRTPTRRSGGRRGMAPTGGEEPSKVTVALDVDGRPVEVAVEPEAVHWVLSNVEGPTSDGRRFIASERLVAELAEVGITVTPVRQQEYANGTVSHVSGATLV